MVVYVERRTPNREVLGLIQWRSGRASDSESRGPGFDPHRCRSVVSLSEQDTLTLYSTG